MHKPPRRAAADDELNTNAHGGISLVFIRAGIPRFGVVGLIIIIAHFDQKINSTKKNRADARKQKKTTQKHKKHSGAGGRFPKARRGRVFIVHYYYYYYYKNTLPKSTKTPRPQNKKKHPQKAEKNTYFPPVFSRLRKSRSFLSDGNIHPR